MINKYSYNVISQYRDGTSRLIILYKDGKKVAISNSDITTKFKNYKYNK